MVLAVTHTDAARGARALLVASGACPAPMKPTLMPPVELMPCWSPVELTLRRRSPHRARPVDNAPPIELLVETIVNCYRHYLLDEMWASSTSLSSSKEKERCH
jgi:hypothetical protein